jgi:hypothetical protein
VEARKLEADFIKLPGHQPLKIVAQLLVVWELPPSLGADVFMRRLFNPYFREL